MTSAVEWLMSKFLTNFTRNSKFHIRMTILCQLRDSVKLALLNVFGVGVSSHILYSCIVYLYVSGRGSITSVGEERANLSAVVY